MYGGAHAALGLPASSSASVLVATSGRISFLRLYISIYIFSQHGPFCALAAPWRHCNPTWEIKLFLVPAAMAFVSGSANWSSVGTLSTEISFVATRSCSHKYFVLTCLCLPKPLPEAKLLAALQSVFSFSVRTLCTPQSSNKALIPNPCAAPLTDA